MSKMPEDSIGKLVQRASHRDSAGADLVRLPRRLVAGRAQPDVVVGDRALHHAMEATARCATVQNASI
jgi:hypothetical protein